MNQKFIVILLMSLSEDMFIFVSSFVFGYCVGYYSYDFFEAKSVKDEIIDFILRCNIKHGIVNKKNRTNKNQWWNLEHEFNFLHNLEQKIEEKFDDSGCSNFFGKKSRSFCIEMKEEFDQKKAKKLIELLDWITDEHFVKKSILRQVSWCAQQLLQKRILNYKRGEELVKRVYLVEFYWFNKSLLCSRKNETESSLIINCNYCKFFSCFLMCVFLLEAVGSSFFFGGVWFLYL